MAVPQRSRSRRSVAAEESVQRAEPAAPVSRSKGKRPPASEPGGAASKPRRAPKASATAAAAQAPQGAPGGAEPLQGAAGTAAQQAAAANGSPFARTPFAEQAAAFGLPGMEAWMKEAMASYAKGQGGTPWASAWSQSLPPAAKVEPVKQAIEAMGRSIGGTMQSLVGLSIPPEQLKAIQDDYLQQAGALWNQALSQPAAIELRDKRFAAPEWGANPASAFTAAMYLLHARTLQRLADSLQGDEKARQRVRFAVQQWADAASPSNYLALNPEALKKAVDTKGESLAQGMQLLMHDLRQGHMSQTDERVFEVGRNVATTAGAVVYENPYFQLIEYAPLTPKVHEVPFLFVPPCINKYYILDLQPDNSLVRYLIEQGHRVFMVSWVNADDSLAQATWDDYVEQGVMRAIDVTREITGRDKINALGFCVGGTLLGTALATLAARGEKPVESLTLLTAYLDFADTGVMDVFVDEAMVRMREMTIGAESPQGGGLMKGADLAATFSFLRANDLVWNYVVGNYLKGEMPPAFDLLYWNSDSTNLPGPMYCWYLRNTYLENKLSTPGAVTVCGEPLDLRRLDMPTFVYGSREDHIVPWQAAYASTQLVSGERRFVLGASGHIAGVINPPAKKKRSHWQSSSSLARSLPASSKAWLDAADEVPGSWWPVWSEWLGEHAGGMVAAPRQLGSKQHPPIEAAPGRYVLRKA